MTDYEYELTDKEIIGQLKNRIRELETAMDAMAKADFDVVRYFAKRSNGKT